jgi:manganese-dependent ADP-ribose/CDP-alcohol diphosphatase
LCLSFAKDPYENSIYSKGRQQGLDEAALAELCKHNANARKWVEENPDVVQTERMSIGFPYFDGLEGVQQRWVPYNGGLGPEQLKWLKEQLAGGLVSFSSRICPLIASFCEAIPVAAMAEAIANNAH